MACLCGRVTLKPRMPNSRNSRKKIAELADQKWEIDSINAARREARVVQQRRKRMTDGIADHAVDSRAARESGARGRGASSRPVKT